MQQESRPGACMVPCQYKSSVVKAAHLVSKILNPREVAHLFGIKEASDDFFTVGGLVSHF
jgi:hypothetical protein